MNARSAAVIAIIVIAAGAVTGILLTNTARAASDVTKLPPVEVRSYQGKDLSSVSSYRENSIRGPQHINISEYRLTVTGLTNRTLVYSYDDILGKYPHYSKVVTLFCVDGWDSTILWEGVLVKDLISDAGIDTNANTVIFTARDGYTTSFPLDYLEKNDIIMAYRMNNITMPAERGYPFELVAENKWGYKWIKWIEKIELSDDPDYEGYWEQRGYSTNGDINESFFA